MEHPQLVRNVALVGAMHSGKTALMDVPVHATHPDVKRKKNGDFCKYTDCRTDEQGREISLKACPLSLVLQDSNDKSFLLNLIDTPGHSNFRDEVVASLRIADGVAIVVDVSLGLTTALERNLQLVLLEKLPVVLVLNQIDRFIIELRLPPGDAYHKIRHTIDEVNGFLRETAKSLGLEEPAVLSPQAGNVVFASAQYNVMFTLDSFAKLYADTHNQCFEAKRFAQNLFGD